MAIVEKRVIGDIHDLVALPDKLIDEFGRNAPWFRGHACSHWKLQPEAYRDFEGEDEAQMANMFFRWAPARHRDCPEVGNIGAWVCLMRHYGLPTRLLDWTTSILVAAHFALCPGPSCDEMDGAIWCLNAGELNKAAGLPGDRVFQLTSPPVASILKGVWGEEGASEATLAALPVHSDLRMMLQQSAFTVHGSSAPLEERTDLPNLRLVKAVIPLKSKKNLGIQVRQLGITEATLFPDLAHLAADIAAFRRALRGPKGVKDKP